MGATSYLWHVSSGNLKTNKENIPFHMNPNAHTNMAAQLLKRPVYYSFLGSLFRDGIKEPIYFISRYPLCRRCDLERAVHLV